MPRLDELQTAGKKSPKLRAEILKLLKQWTQLKAKLDAGVHAEVKHGVLSTAQKEIGPPSTAEKKALSVGVARCLRKIARYRQENNFDTTEAFLHIRVEARADFEDKAKNPHGLDRTRAVKILLEVWNRLQQPAPGVTQK